MIKFSYRFLFVISLVTVLTGCYRMPTENDFSLIPTTNNPSVTCQKSQGLMPSATY